jgi:hypothetical protein
VPGAVNDTVTTFEVLFGEPSPDHEYSGLCFGRTLVAVPVIVTVSPGITLAGEAEQV